MTKTASAQPAAVPSLLDYHLVSLSHINDPDRVNLYPGDPELTMTTVTTIEEHGFYLQYVSQGEHTSTHWGAPAHFNLGELAADQLDPRDLFLPAVKVDIRQQASVNPDYAVSIADLLAWEAQYGRIPNESAIVLWTGWESKWGTDAFFNFDENQQMHQPGFSLEVAQWLVETGRLGRRGALGTDAFCPEIATDQEYRVSKLLYREHRISLEVMANLAQLPETGAYILAGGTMNRRGSGSPATIFAFVPR